jgi:hypothetical protein
MRLALLAPLALALTGCLMVPVHHAPPPRAIQLISEQQAVDVAAGYARARGHQVQRTTRAVLDDRARWHIDLVGPDDHASVLVDAISGRVLKARLRAGPPPPLPPPGPSAPPPGDPATQGPARDDSWDE